MKIPTFRYHYHRRPYSLDAKGGYTAGENGNDGRLIDRLTQSYSVRRESPSGQWLDIFLDVAQLIAEEKHLNQPDALLDEAGLCRRSRGVHAPMRRVLQDCLSMHHEWLSPGRGVLPTGNVHGESRGGVPRSSPLSAPALCRIGPLQQMFGGFHSTSPIHRKMLTCGGPREKISNGAAQNLIMGGRLARRPVA